MHDWNYSRPSRSGSQTAGYTYLATGSATMDATEAADYTPSDESGLRRFGVSGDLGSGAADKAAVQQVSAGNCPHKSCRVNCPDSDT